MNRPQIWNVLGVILLLFGLELFIGSQLYAQQADLNAVTAAKAAAGRETLNSYARDAIAPVGTFTPFDAPSAGAGSQQGTWSVAINLLGTTTGFYYDEDSVAHGFFRAPNGTITPFDAPGAGTGAQQGTYSVAINLWGTTTGFYYDGDFVAHGFWRAPNGTITPFDAPGAAAPGALGTVPSSINPEGIVTGTFAGADLVLHGFLRAPNGDIKQFDDPSAGTGSFQGTDPVAINLLGETVGCYSDSNSNSFGFLRTARGNLSPVSPPGSVGFNFSCSSVLSALPDFFGLQSLAINDVGAITGGYFLPIEGNPFGGNYRGFARAPGGTYSTFDAVSSPSSPCCTWTFPVSINLAGEIAGFDNDFDSVNHGFLRTRKGAITLFDAPGAGVGPAQGTVAASINPLGVITGYYIDANNVSHGFLFLPRG